MVNTKSRTRIGVYRDVNVLMEYCILNVVCNI